MRMFVAAWPDEATVHRLASLDLGTDHGLRLVRPEQWHVTLRFLGNVPMERVPELMDALGTAAGGLAAPVHCELGPGTVWFSGDRVLQIPVAGLDEAARAVRSATRLVIPETGIRPEGFTGHLTIARTRRHRPGASQRAALAGIAFSTTFHIDHLDLVASEPTPQGHRYTVVGRATLLR